MPVEFSVSSFYPVCGFGGMVVSVSPAAMNGWNCILQCHLWENSKSLPLLLFSMNFVAPWKWPHPSKPFEIRHQHTSHTEWPWPISFLVEYLMPPCYCTRWIIVRSQPAGSKKNRARFANKQLSSNVFAVTLFSLPYWLPNFRNSIHIEENENVHTHTPINKSLLCLKFKHESPISGMNFTLCAQRFWLYFDIVHQWERQCFCWSDR